MQLYGWCDQHLMVRLMEYGYSSTIIASVEISALLFFPYPLEWVECDSWAFNKLHEFQILFSHNMGDMACSRCRQGVGSLIGWNGISGVFKTMRTWIHQVPSGSAVHIYKKQRTSLCPIFNNQSFFIYKVTFPAFGSGLKLRAIT